MVCNAQQLQESVNTTTQTSTLSCSNVRPGRTFARPFRTIAVISTASAVFFAAGCGGLKGALPGPATSREIAVDASVEPHVDVGTAETVETTSTVPTESLVSTVNLKPVLDALGDLTAEIKTVTTTLQDLRQQQGTADTTLAAGLERVETLTQNVQTSVSTYALDPETQALLAGMSATEKRNYNLVVAFVLAFALFCLGVDATKSVTGNAILLALGVIGMFGVMLTMVMPSLPGKIFGAF